MDDAINRRRLSSGVQTPVTFLTCNFSAPVDGKAALFTHNEVTTLFHEFGHGLHLLLTQVDELGVSGLNGVEWDAVELPSQFMENWCYHRETLLGLTGHFATGAPLPEATFRKIEAARTFRAGSDMLRQLFFSLLDLELHDGFDPDGAQTAFDVQQRVAARASLLAPLAEDRFLCSFGHIFAGGYAAGYYSYKWAEVLSADAFAAFEEAGLENAAALSATGRRYRDTVLGLGGSAPAMEVFKRFRGREPKTDALLRHYGLLAA
jgi:oligopeptidase A